MLIQSSLTFCPNLPEKLQIDIKQPQILKNITIFIKNTVNFFSKGFAYSINMASHPFFVN